MKKLVTTITVLAAVSLAVGPGPARAGGGPHVRVFDGQSGANRAGLLLPAVQAPRSAARHRGGANFVMGDGSVRNVDPGYRNSFQCIPASCATDSAAGGTMHTDSWESPGN